MIKVLTILEELCNSNELYYYAITKHCRVSNETFRVEFFLSLNDNIVISSIPYCDDLVEVWTIKHPRVHIPKDALLEYLFYIIKAEFNG